MIRASSSSVLSFEKRDAAGFVGGGAEATTGFFDGVKGFYPALTFGIGAFVLGTLSLEFYRGVRARRHQQGETLPVAASRMMWRNKRRCHRSIAASTIEPWPRSLALKRTCTVAFGVTKLETWNSW